MADGSSDSSIETSESDPESGELISYDVTSESRSRISSHRHDQLGPCRFLQHDNYMDCRCRCRHCREEEIEAVIRRRIRNGGYFRKERRLRSNPAAPPHHNETVGLPRIPFNRDQLYRIIGGLGYSPVTTEPILAANSGVDVQTQGRGSMIPMFSRRAHNDTTIALFQRPCTELTPWNRMTRAWQGPCPNDRRGLGGEYMGASWPCNEIGCGNQINFKRIPQWDHVGDRIPSKRRLDYLDSVDLEEQRDLLVVTQEIPPSNPQTHNKNRWSCQAHQEDNAAFWEPEKLLEAHLLPSCKVCKKAYQDRYPDGINNCICPELLGRWQCRRCLEKKIALIQRRFKRRVCAYYTGRFDPALLPEEPLAGEGLASYHLEPDDNRAALRRALCMIHPCIDPELSQRCGGRRAQNHRAVLQCRSCGGVIVKSKRRTAPIAPKTLRSDRRNARAPPPLQELVLVGRNLVATTATGWRS